MNPLRKLLRYTAAAGAALYALGAGAQMLTMSSVPLYVGANVQPLVMLALSKDQQLYKKAYNDYSDLDGDGDFETTYKHSINYYGYFDPYKCYSYITANMRFEPQADTSGLAAANQKYCDTVAGEWSGNFLNWATMTRMDAVRKLLYGGLRSPDRTNGDGNGLADGDTTTGTVLERSYIPTDAHAWVKYYRGTDITRLTPVTPDNFTRIGTIDSGGTNIQSGVAKRVQTTVAFTTAEFITGDVVEFAVTASPTVNFMRGVITAVDTANRRITMTPTAVNIGGAGSYAGNAWTVTNLSKQGISICNTTLGGAAPQDKSQTNTNLPRMRVAKGNFSLWSANERWQCRWSAEQGANNSNNFGASSIPAYNSNPNQATVGAGNGTIGSATGQGDFFVRVQACVSTLIGTEKCKQYPSGNFKPIGLLQTYGDTGLLQFGLMTGSYAKNVSGGVLRKNTGPLTDEVNVNTDGRFVPASLAAGYAGIINTINRMRIWGYNYADGTYLGAGGDNCGFQLTAITENNCTSWGNPMSEIYYETARYFAGGKTSSSTLQPTTAYTYVSAGSKDASLGLPLPAWTDPLSQNTYCAPLNTIVFNASVSTNDDGQAVAGSTKTTLPALTTAQLGNSFSAAAAANTIVQWTDLIGGNTGENIHGGSYFVGRSGASVNEFCSAKTVTSLGAISGICPEGPTQAGSYLIGGLAYMAHTNRIRSDLTVPASNNSALKVDTYAVQLATNVPQLSLQLTGETTPRAVIQPAYRLFNAAPQGGGALVDLRIIDFQRGANFHRGRVYLNWEDSEQGGDYDQDMWGILSWCMQTGANVTSCPGQGANTVSVTTQTIAQSTANGQGFGYIISGTTTDGPHFHSGILGFNFTDPNPPPTVVSPSGQLNASRGCQNCQVGAAASTATYALGTSVGVPLRDPLFYAAKWGGFKESGTGGNNRPDLQAEWDQKDATGNAIPDGIPDNYFLVSNPLGLESALDKAFVAILTTSSASSVATNSTSLNTGSRIFQARFNSNDWSGQLLSFTIDLNGVIASVEEWDAGQKINLQDPLAVGSFPTVRNIATMDAVANPRVGVPFRWASLNAAQQTALNTNIANVNDGQGAARLNYLRGSPANEGLGTANFRRRITSKLGDIVNSNPQFVGPPNAPIPASDPNFAAYQTFRTTHASRPPAIYLGANDGMIHAFDASTTVANQGKELFAYVPSNVYYKLPWLSAQNYAHRFFNDGTPIVADAFVNGDWKTVLAATQAAGGQSIVALDVTTPSANTEANAASWVLWEFKDADHQGRIGNVYGYPQIAKMNNDKWAVIVSSGYNSSYRCTALPCTGGGDYIDTDDSPFGRANLYIIYIENGITNGGNWVVNVDFVRLNTLTGSQASPNGLTPPTLVDTDGDGKVDFVYAGDLRGNLWKFDVTSNNHLAWNVAFSTQPLYTARDPSGVSQVITAPVAVMDHSLGGHLVLFGTGQYIQPADPNPPYGINSFYAIWDWHAKVAHATNPNVGPSADRITTSVTTRDSALLQKQDYVTTCPSADCTLPTGAGAIEFRVWTANDTTYTLDPGTSQRGWYTDFPSVNLPGRSDLTGERMVVAPIIRNGKAIITTLVPSTTSCDAGGSGWLTDLDALTGKRLDESPFDVNNDLNFTSSDFVTVMIGGVPTQVAVSSRKSQVGITPMPTVIAGGPGKEFKVTSGSTGGRESILENPGGAPSSGTTRRSWREILSN